MQTADEILKDIKNTQKRRRVTFSEDVIDYERPITFYQRAKKEPHYSRIKKNTLRYLSEGKYEELNLYLKSYTPQQIETFYRKEGETLFSWAIIDARVCTPLKFLIENVTDTITHDILSNNNFSLLKSFLGGRSVADQHGHFTKERKTNLIEKLKVLLDFDSTELHDAIEEIIKSSFITSNIKECFEVAKLQKEAPASTLCL